VAHRFTIGVEEEFQIIDPETLELRSHVIQLLSAAASRGLGDQIKQEMHQSIVETGTKICENVGELRLEMHRTRHDLVAAAESGGDTSLLQLDRSGHLAGRTLPEYR